MGDTSPVTIYKGVETTLSLDLISASTQGLYGDGLLSNLAIIAIKYNDEVDSEEEWELSNILVYTSGWKLTITDSETNQDFSYWKIMIMADEIELFEIDGVFSETIEYVVLKFFEVGQMIAQEVGQSVT